MQREFANALSLALSLSLLSQSLSSSFQHNRSSLRQRVLYSKNPFHNSWCCVFLSFPHPLILSPSIPNHLIVSPLFQSSVTRSFNLRFKMLNYYILLYFLYFLFLLHQASILVPDPNAPKFRLTFNEVFTKFKLQTRPTTTQSCNFYKNLSTFPWAPSCSSCANGFHGEILFNSLIIRSQINQLCFNGGRASVVAEVSKAMPRWAE